jgi:hypothetical protein
VSRAERDAQKPSGAPMPALECSAPGAFSINQAGCALIAFSPPAQCGDTVSERGCVVLDQPMTAPDSCGWSSTQQARLLQAFRKFGGCLSRRDILKIARRFNTGNLWATKLVPKGRLNAREKFDSTVPPGTEDELNPNPALKRWAIDRLSLRDNGARAL